MFLHVSVILFTGGGSPGPYPGGLRGLAGTDVSRPIPRGKFGGSGPGGLQANTQGRLGDLGRGGVSRPRPGGGGGVYSSMY